MMEQGEQPISAMMIGEMGIKTALVGSKTILERPGGFVYLQLETKEGE